MIELWHPLAALPPGTWRVTTLLALLGLTALVGWRTAGDFKTPLTPRGIVDLELAGTSRRAAAIIKQWTAAGKRQAFLGHLRWDNVFLVCYSTALALGVLMAAGVLFRRGSRLYDAAILLAWAQWAAGLLDLFENLALRRMFDALEGETLPRITLLCAAPKFAIVALGVLFTLATLVAWLVGWHTDT